MIFNKPLYRSFMEYINVFNQLYLSGPSSLKIMTRDSNATLLPHIRLVHHAAYISTKSHPIRELALINTLSR